MRFRFPDDDCTVLALPVYGQGQMPDRSCRSDKRLLSPAPATQGR
jgi:hypothetical protein